MFMLAAVVQRGFAVPYWEFSGKMKDFQKSHFTNGQTSDKIKNITKMIE
jgi:hypothetical protein